MRGALWERLVDEKVVRCKLCAHGCRMKDDQKGRCGVRAASDGRLVSLVADVVSSVQMDPVEKKPLFHFLPGTQTYSIGSVGCNFSCAFCQNYTISQVPPNGVIRGKHVDPAELVGQAENYGAPSMAFTYNEPTVFYELVSETAKLAEVAGIRCLLVSNGFMSEHCLHALGQFIHAANIDLKSFRDSFYKDYCGGRLEPVLKSLRNIREMGWWLEVTTLVIPGANDSPEEMRDIARFIRDELGHETPWHLSAFHGAYRWADRPTTPLTTLDMAWRIGREEGLSYVYVGNVASAIGSNTFCPKCGMLHVERRGYRTRVHGTAGVCSSCGTAIPGVWR
ncbi:MAG: AmmeMemoRadiSam system radical SAM enzyme [Desulfovibrio sp.]|jgi:pyruvate formate lyase activating enzyme|nr:AmmeMemoRadiSam system radical SAM enzyme [Desulfovibrio sp.]